MCLGYCSANPDSHRTWDCYAQLGISCLNVQLSPGGERVLAWVARPGWQAAPGAQQVCGAQATKRRGDLAKKSDATDHIRVRGCEFGDGH